MRLVRTLLASSLAAVVLAVAAAPAGAQTTPTLVAVRAARHPGFDRVVFEFRGGLPSHRVRYVDRLIADGSGDLVTVAGAADLEVVFEGADAHDQQGQPTVSPRRFSPGLTAVKEVAQVSDFEATVIYGIGLDRRRSLEVSTLSGPPRLVVDVSTAGGPVADGTDALPFTGPGASQGLLITGIALLVTGAAALALGRRTRTP